MVQELLEGLGLAFVTGTALVVSLLVLLAVYIYFSYTLMVIAQKTKTENAWLAWIPIANLYLMTQIAQVPWWTFLIVLLASWIPFIGQLLAIGISIWWWWKISERRNSPGWLGILMIFPLVNFVVVGYLAFKR